MHRGRSRDRDRVPDGDHGWGGRCTRCGRGRDSGLPAATTEMRDSLLDREGMIAGENGDNVCDNDLGQRDYDALKLAVSADFLSDARLTHNSWRSRISWFTRVLWRSRAWWFTRFFWHSLDTGSSASLLPRLTGQRSAEQHW
jgi:hypothetical protein